MVILKPKKLYINTVKCRQDDGRMIPHPRSSTNFYMIKKIKNRGQGSSWTVASTDFYY
jgi:hypothetical protein